MNLHLHTRTAAAVRLLRPVWQARRVQRDGYTWDELVDFTRRFGDGFLNLLQVNSEITALLTKVESIRPKRVLEIGTAGGGTFFLLSRAAHPGAILISLDLPNAEWAGGHYHPWRKHLHKHLVLSTQKAHFIQGDSHSPESLARVRRLLAGNALDFLFIDGDHSYEGVRQDYEMYAPLVRKGGLIAFHDVAEHRPELQCEVSRFWNEVRVGKEHHEFIDDRNQGWAGIGVLVAG